MATTESEHADGHADGRSDGRTPQDTRAAILRVSLEEFAARGYHGTSVREIAEGVGVTKTAVLYHFPSKADIVGALADPMLRDLDRALDAAAALADADADRARWAAIKGMLDVWLAHRYLLRMNLQDLGLASGRMDFNRFRDAMIRANALVAGPGPDFAGLVEAAQAIAMLSDPVVLFADAPTAELRAAVLRGVARLLRAPAPEPAPASEPVPAPAAPGRPRRGRPGVVDPATAEAAQRLYDGGSSAARIAAELGISRATVYRHLRVADERVGDERVADE
jgi:AcrR family transcriptional regulator